jgi:hypothetical protein
VKSWRLRLKSTTDRPWRQPVCPNIFYQSKYCRSKIIFTTKHHFNNLPTSSTKIRMTCSFPPPSERESLFRSVNFYKESIFYEISRQLRAESNISCEEAPVIRWLSHGGVGSVGWDWCLLGQIIPSHGCMSGPHTASAHLYQFLRALHSASHNIFKRSVGNGNKNMSWKNWQDFFPADSILLTVRRTKSFL